MPIPVSYKLYTGPITLAGNFPPTLNKDQDATRLEINESPDAYGIDWDVEGIMKTGSVPTGVSRVTPVGDSSPIDYSSWNWYYNRLMKVDQTGDPLANTAELLIGAPEYRGYYYEQDVGSRTSGYANIVTFMPALQESLWICTATGSHMMNNMRDPRAFFWLGDFEQRFFAEAANRCVTLQGIPYVCNASGIFRWDGQNVEEVTRPVRNNISPFSATEIKADYDEKLIIGTNAFVYDSGTNRLFDYSTSGFRFTSRTLQQPAIQGIQPYEVKGIAFLFDITASGNQKFTWESKFDNGNWFAEDDVIINQKEKRLERAINNPQRTAREFTMRITSMTAGVRLREIQLAVQGYSQETVMIGE